MIHKELAEVGSFIPEHMEVIAVEKDGQKEVMTNLVRVEERRYIDNYYEKYNVVGMFWTYGACMDGDGIFFCPMLFEKQFSHFKIRHNGVLI